MARLIDADKLITDIQGSVSEVCMRAPFDREWFTRLHDRQREIVGIIEHQPTVDASLRVHGRWNEKYKGCFNPYACSNCGSCSNTKTNYCPVCGAKMDGGEKK